MEFFFSNVAIFGNSRAPVSFNKGFKIKQIHSAYVRQDLHIQQVLTILDLLTTVPFITGMWRLWVVTCPRVISAVAQHTPIWPTGVKPFSDPGNLITNTPTSASWFSVGWIAIADSGFFFVSSWTGSVRAKPTLANGRLAISFISSWRCRAMT